MKLNSQSGELLNPCLQAPAHLFTIYDLPFTIYQVRRDKDGCHESRNGAHSKLFATSEIAAGGNAVMKNENIVSMLERLVTEANALSEGKSSVEIDEDPRICALMLQAESIIEELDQIVHTAFPTIRRK